MTVTSADVARRAGVSRSTVSQVLNGHGDRFPENTRERVAAAARELGYQPSAAGRALVRGASDIVVALIPDMTVGPTLQDFLNGATDELARHGLTLLLRLASTSPESTEAMIAGLRPAAVMCILPVPERLRERIAQLGIRLVEPGPPDNRDVNTEIGRAQALHLIERGYRQIAYAHLSDKRQDTFGDARERGAREACEVHGLTRPRVIRLAPSVDEAVTQLRALEAGTAVACYNDDVAATLLGGCRELGLRVPHDIALAGTDDTAIARLSFPAITTFGYALGPYVSDAAEVIRDASSPGGHLPAFSPGFQIRLVQGGTT